MLNRKVIADLADDIFQHNALQNALPDVHRHTGGDIVDDRHRRTQATIKMAVNGVQRSHVDLGKNSTAIKRFDNTPLMLQELFEDGVSAAVGDVGVVKYYIKQHPEKQFKLVPDAKFERQYFGIAVAKGNSELLGKINAGLQKIVADGTYAKIYKTWFDDNVPTLPAQ